MMKTHIILVLLAVFGCVYSQEDTEVHNPDSDVLVLTEDNFQEAISTNPLIAVEFYAPWCGHCKHLAPEWEKAATAVKGKVAVAKVDCTKHEELCQQFGVQGFPTLKIFRDGEVAPLEVARNSEAIVSFLNKELEPAVTKIKEGEEEEYVTNHPISLIMYLDNDHDDRFQTYEKAAQQNRHTVSFAAVIGPSSLHPSNTLILRRNFDEPSLVYKGEFSQEGVKPWLYRHLVPLIGEIHAENFQSYMNVALPLGYLFLNPAEDNTALLDGLKAAASRVKDSLMISWINNQKYGRQAERLGLSGTTVPALVIDNSRAGKRYVFPETEAFTVEAVSSWLDKVASGDVSAHIKSEPIPESNDGPVTVVVAKTFEQIVLDTSKNVLVEFYAPWCGHCKTLAPIYEELGEEYKNNQNVVIAKIDATANDVDPAYGVTGFPTLMLFTAGGKQTPLKYEGPRTLEALSDYLVEQIPTLGSEDSEDKDEL